MLLAIFVAGAVGDRAARPAQRGTDAAGAFSRVLAVAIAVRHRAEPGVPADAGRFDLGSSLPLQLCDFAWMTAAWALWTRQPAAGRA